MTRIGLNKLDLKVKRMF